MPKRHIWRGIPQKPEHTTGAVQYQPLPAQSTALTTVTDTPLTETGGPGRGNAMPPRSVLGALYGADPGLPVMHRAGGGFGNVPQLTNVDRGMFLAKSCAVMDVPPGVHLGHFASTWNAHQAPRGAVPTFPGHDEYPCDPDDRFTEDTDHGAGHAAKRPSMAVPLAMVAIGALVALALAYDIGRGGE